MAKAGAVLVATLDLLEGKVAAGVSTAELDAVAERFIRSQGATPTFKGYRGFPGSICASPNAMIVHGIPGPHRLGRGRDHLDRRRRDARRLGRRRGPHLPRGGDQRSRRATCSTRPARSLHAGVAECRPGNRMGDVSSAIQRVAEDAGLSVVRSLVGHGVGRSMHEDPQVPNYGKPGKGPLLEEGMVLAIEPMTTAGQARGAGRRGTVGRSSPRTGHRPPTSSSPSRSPPAGRSILTPGTLRRDARPAPSPLLGEVASAG